MTWVFGSVLKIPSHSYSSKCGICAGPGSSASSSSLSSSSVAGGRMRSRRPQVHGGKPPAALD